MARIRIASIAELSLHDWSLISIFGGDQTDAARSALILLKQNRDFVILSYALTQNLERFEAPKEWSLSKRGVLWLYDELDMTRESVSSLIHRILLSDGTTLRITFSNCRAFRGSAIGARTQRELQIA